MADLVIRRLLIDLNTPFARLWNGGDAFRTAYFNALSMSFPAGEQFFIDAVRNGVDALPAGCDAVVTDTQGFVAQEATHRRIHALFNAQLAEQGHVNTWEKRIRVRQQRLEGVPPLHAVAATAASEHFTAIFSAYLLTHPQVFEGAEPRLRTMWLWHSAEELEHRCTAFDLYRALDGDEFWRR
ncbi:MAG TPA: metal-dependent hydrolase, partial [Burkholderiaceae bacterium]|nr:metal-dependent hydrolase [Burkholderiaceae bacterium]